jgi:hypothetical protein
MLIDEIRNIRSSKRDLRNFGITVGIALIVLGGTLYWLEKALFLFFLIPGLVVFLCGLLAPFILKPMQKVWMTFAVIIGWLMTRVILSVLFYIVITSIGLISKLLNKKYLDMKIDESQKSYWNYRDRKEFERSYYEKLY